MLKLNASYSKKVPVKGADYSSQSYHASVEVEIPDGLSDSELRTRIHDTFALVRTSVEAELTAEPAEEHKNSHEFPPASPKQIKFLTDIALKRGMDIKTLNAEARQRYSVPAVDALDRRQASEFIDALSDGSSRNRRKAA